MVSVLDTGLNGLGSSPVWEDCDVFLGKTFTVAVPLSTPMYRCVMANLMLLCNHILE